MFSATSISATSIDTISNAVCESSELLQHRLRDQVGVGQHVGVVLGAADGLDDALADAGDDGLLGGPADQAVELGPHRHPRPGLELDAVLADAVERLLALGRVGAVDDLGIDADLDGLEHVAAGQVDGGGHAPGQVHAGLVGGDDRGRHLRHVAARQDVGLHLLRRDLDAGLHQGDLLADDHGVVDVQELHADHVRRCRCRPRSASTESTAARS